MYPIVLTSIVLVGITLERVASLYRPRLDVALALTRVRRVLESGDVAGALRLVTMDGWGAFGRLAGVALRESLQPVPRIEAATAGALLVELPRLRRRIPAIVICGQIGTLLGLYGAITGLMGGFGHYNTDAGSRAVMLARGLAESMHDTAAGLLVAIVAVLAHGLLTARAGALAEDLALAGTGIVNALRENRARLRWNGDRAPLDRPTYREAA